MHASSFVRPDGGLEAIPNLMPTVARNAIRANHACWRAGGDACASTNAELGVGSCLRRGSSCSRSVGDHLVQLGACVTLLTGELDEFRDPIAEFALGGCSDYPDAAARGHLEQSLVAQRA